MGRPPVVELVGDTLPEGYKTKHRVGPREFIQYNILEGMNAAMIRKIKEKRINDPAIVIIKGDHLNTLTPEAREALEELNVPPAGAKEGDNNRVGYTVRNKVDTA